jgi:hypothetical protein
MRAALFLNGSVGVGKTTLGRVLARELGGGFLDSDDLGDPARRWVEQIRTTSALLVERVAADLATVPVMVIAKPLRARDWCYFQAHLGRRGIETFCITLTAAPAAILDPGRGRRFDAWERRRTAAMAQEGYGARPFSDAVVATDRAGFTETVAQLEAICRSLLAPGAPP